ncbi:DMT family transporter [Devosia nitrariae]|uniref:Membrane protein n=1 Tax=Devosia nitrariae TaxID=2071872 RepID=A0ABQ5WCN4_9HYPH|nr:DMT family transporter [Devosia nitrariae]GLQ57361.1 membrane protein [Devosia nitrariae]
MPIGIFFALAAYSIYSCGDAVIKSFGSSLSVFEIGFFIGAFSLLPALFAKPKGERWREAFRLRHPFLVHLRSFSGVASAMLVTYAFVTIAFAETYSLVFLMPVFITLFSVILLKERVGVTRWLLLLVGFAGVLLVVRPGFRELGLGHLAAVLCPVFGAITTTVLRVIAGKEKRVTLILLPAIYVLVVNAILMIPAFVVPTLGQFLLLAVSGSFIGMGHILLIAATRNAPASQVAPVQYVQIVWAIGIGAAFFSEVPDVLAFLGLTLVVVSGLVNIFLDGARARIASRFAEYRARKGSTNPPVSEVRGPQV